MRILWGFVIHALPLTVNPISRGYEEGPSRSPPPGCIELSVNYIYFPLSSLNCLSCTSMENITLISLWAVARTAIL